ncbi:Bestrophin/UPF0187 [Hyaloraphidium curvatum]|nr:Bestrophin/UPF0187 [Hyaloraphidium curvatum]
MDRYRALKPELKDVAQLLGLAVFLILTFRNNSAYNRWYEGTTRFYELSGAIHNAGRLVATLVPGDPAVDLIWWLVAALFCAKQQLRASPEFGLLKAILPPAHWAELELRKDKFRWSVFRFGALGSTVDVPGKTAGRLMHDAVRSMEPVLGSFTACSRILNTPMPFAYLSHLRSFLIVWLALLPWVFVGNYAWGSVPLGVVICYGVLGIEEAAVEVEQPFGRDRNDAPLDEIAEVTLKLLFDYLWLVDPEGRTLGGKACLTGA